MMEIKSVHMKNKHVSYFNESRFCVQLEMFLLWRARKNKSQFVFFMSEEKKMPFKPDHRHSPAEDYPIKLYNFSFSASFE